MHNQNLLRKIKAKYGNRSLKLCWASRGGNDVVLENLDIPQLTVFYRLDAIDLVAPEMGTMNQISTEQWEEPYEVWLNGRLVYWDPIKKEYLIRLWQTLKKKLLKT